MQIGFPSPAPPRAVWILAAWLWELCATCSSLEHLQQQDSGLDLIFLGVPVLEPSFWKVQHLLVAVLRLQNCGPSWQMRWREVSTHGSPCPAHSQDPPFCLLACSATGWSPSWRPRWNETMSCKVCVSSLHSRKKPPDVCIVLACRVPLL